ncbi:MAG: hypothetical protein HWD85_07140 [Flavobacteriaceae bacterium]|nr:hypothetical protein [Flavobacteriaceae bacterium]
MNRIPIDFNRKIPPLDRKVRFLYKENGFYHFKINENNLRHFISRQATFLFHLNQLKKESHSKILNEDIPVYKYTQEYFYLLLSHMEDYEKKHLKLLVNFKSKDTKQLLLALDDFCYEVLTSKISTIRSIEYSHFCLDRYSKDLFKDLKEYQLKEFKNNVKTIEV